MRITRGQLRRIIQEAARLREVGLTRGAAEAALPEEPFSLEDKLMRTDNVSRAVEEALDQLSGLLDGPLAAASDSLASLPDLVEDMLQREQGSDLGADPDLEGIRDQVDEVTQGAEAAVDAVSALVDSLGTLRDALEVLRGGVGSEMSSPARRYVDPQEVLQAYLELSDNGAETVTVDQLAQELGVDVNTLKSSDREGTTLSFMPDGTVREMI